MNQQNNSMFSQNQVSEKLEIFISARNLKIPNSTQLSSSYAVVYLTQYNKTRKQVLKTDGVLNNPNPNYAQSLVINFVFEVKQILQFQVYHGKDCIGKATSSVGQIFGSITNGAIKGLLNKQNMEVGKLVLRCEKIHEGSRNILKFEISARNIPNLRWFWMFGGTYPFFRIYRKRKSDQLLLYESEVLGHNLHPKWKAFQLSKDKFCKNDENSKIQAKLYSFSSNGNHTLLGSTCFTARNLADSKFHFPITLNGVSKGELIFNAFKEVKRNMFGDFIQNGLQLALTIGIDFTLSNGDPRQLTSLHYPNKVTKNTQYEDAMNQVLDILLQYDFDKLVPCYGFGGKVKHPKFDTKNKTHHCFPLNFNKQNPFLFQKPAILRAYRQSFQFVGLGSPTCFTELIKTGMQICQTFKKDEQTTQYMIMLILTDGQIHDKQEVIDLIVKSNCLPMSIIIVGIGKGDFGIMHELDDDNCQLVDSKGQKTVRDLVQFVQFQKYKKNGVDLARQVLEQLPRQVEQYFSMMNIQPNSVRKGRQYKRLLQEFQKLS